MVKKLFVVLLIWLIGGWPTIVFALPQDGTIVGGTGSIPDPVGNTQQINQTSQQMIIDWQSFNIGQGEWVNFNQPNVNAIALNRVIGSDPSILVGKLSANGQVFISNGSGVFFSPGSQVDTHGFVATTMGISNQDFLDRNYNFVQDLDNPLASVINEGNISAASYVGLLAPAVENRGTIVTASLGSIDLASGTAATMDFTGDGLIQFEVTQAVSGTVLDKDGNELEDRVSNKGLLQADGGQIRMSAKDAGDVIRHVVNMEGMIKANSVVEKNGKVFLMGGDSGVVSVSGTIDASGDDAGETGGNVQVTGEYVGLFDEAKVDVSGDVGGGEALIGGDYQGKNDDVQNAFRTYVGEDAVIDVSAKTSGDGGKAIVWADDVTRFYGSVLATGGSQSGDGGFVEVSGKGTLNFHAKEIALGSVDGDDGVLLLDPTDITITATTESGVTGFGDQLEAFAEDTGTSNFNVTAGSGSFAGITGTIELQATNDITVSAAWNLASSTGAANVSVVLRAGNDININAAVTLDGTGTLTLEADGNTANGAGDVVFGASGSVTTGGGNVDITTNDINLTSGSINAGTGTVSLYISDGGTIGLGDANCGGTCGMQISGAEIQNITATNLVIGDNVNGQMTVENVTLANTANITGTTTLNTENTTSGGVVFGTTASSFTGALTVNAGQGITVGTGLTTGGVATFDADSDNDGTGVFTIANSFTLTTTNNNIQITANDIDLTGSIAAGTGTVTLLVSDGADIALDGSLSTGSAGSTLGTCNTACGFTVNGLEIQNISAANLTIGDNTHLRMSVSGLTATHTGNITGTITLNNTGTGSSGIIFGTSASVIAGALTLNAGNGIQIGGAPGADLTIGGLGSFNADTDANGTGVLAIVNSSTVTSNNNNVDITGAGFTLESVTTFLNAGTGDVSIIPTNGRSIGLGDTSGDMHITGATLENITAANLTFGDNTSGSITVDNISGANSTNISGTITLNATAASQTVTFSNNASTFTNALTVSSNGNITQGVALTVGGNASFTSSAGSITLNSGSNNLGTSLTLSTAGNIDVDVGADLADLNVTVAPTGSSTYSITATNLTFTVTESTDVTVTSVADTTGLNLSLTSSTGNITLASSAISVGAGNVSVTASSGNLNIGSSAIDFSQNNTVSLNASGTITGTGLTTVSISQGTKIFTGTASIGTLNLSGTGVLTVIGATSVTTGFDWQGTATINGAGTFSTGSGVTGTMDNNGIKTLDTAIWNNLGDITWSGSTGDSFALTNGATFINAGDFTYTTTAASNITGTSAETVSNSGTITFNSGSATTISALFSNTGSVVVSGTGTVTISTDSGVSDSGTYNVSNASGTMAFSADRIFDSAATFSGTGLVDFAGTTKTQTINTSNFASALSVSLSGTNTTNFNGTHSIANLTLGTGTTLSIGSGATLTVDTGFTWNAASTVGGSGSLSTESGVTTNMTGTGMFTLTSVTWDNDGTINWNESGGNPFVFSSATLNNSGTFNIGNASTSNITGSGRIDNTGVFNHNIAVDTTVAPEFNNLAGGTVNVLNTGDLTFSGSNTTAFNDAGDYDVAMSTGALIFSGTTRDFASTTDFTGVGNVTFSAGTHTLTDSTYASTLITTVDGATVNFDLSSGLTVARLDLTSGVIQGTGDITVTSTFNWSSTVGATTIGGSGTLTTSSGATSTMGGVSAYALNRDWNNAGNTTFANSGGNSITIGSGATFTNSGVFNFTSTGGGIAGASGRIDNSGVFIHNSTSNTSVAPEFNNTGTVHVANTGDLTFSAGNTTGMSDTGVYAVSNASGAIIFSSGTRTFSSTSEFGGAGGITFSGGTITFDNVTMDTTGLVTFGVGISTNNTDMKITAGNIDITTGTFDVGTGDLTVLSSGAGNIALGDDAAGTLKLDDNELGRITANNLIIGDSSFANNIVIDAAVLPTTIATLNLITGSGNVVFDAVSLNTTNANLTVTTTSGSISQTGTLTVGGTTRLTSTSGTITLDEPTNDFIGAVTLSSGTGAVQINDTNTLTLAASTLGGAFTARADDGITVSGNFTTSGATVFNADHDDASGGDLTINSGVTVSSTDHTISVTSHDFDLQGNIDSGTAATSITVSLVATTTGIGSITGSSCGGSPCGMTISNSELQNIKSTGLTIGGSSSGSIYVEGVTATDVANTGTVTLSANSGSKTVNFQTTASTFNALNVSANGGVVIGVDLTTNGALTMDTDNDGTSGGDFNLNAGATIDTNNNDLSISANDISINISGAITAGTGTVTILVSDADDIVLDGTLSSSSAVSTNVSCTTSCGMTINGDEIQNISAGNLIIGDSTNFRLIATALTTTHTGNITGTITLNNTGTTSSGIIFGVSDSEFAGALTLNAGNGIQIGGAPGANLTINGVGTFNADSDGNGSGAFTLVNGATLTSNNNNLSILANAFASSGSEFINAGTGEVSIAHSQSGGTIGLGGGAGTMQITVTQLTNITAGTLNLGSSTTGNMDLTTVTTGGIANVSTVNLISGGNISFNADSMTFFNDSKVASITAASGTVTVPGVSVDDIGVGNATCGGSCGFNITGAKLQTITASTLFIGGSASTNVFVDGVTSTDVANIGTVSLNATGTGFSVSFTNADSSFQGLTVNAAEGVMLTRNVTTTGAVAINADTDVTSGGNLDIADTFTLKTTDNTLDITGFDFELNSSGKLDSGTASTTIRASAPTTIGVGSATGTMTVSTTDLGNITAGSIIIGDSTAGNITVNGVDTNTVATTSMFSFVSGGIVDFDSGSSTFNNGLSVTAAGNVTQNVGVTVVGAASFASTAGDITLITAGNSLGSSLTINAGGNFNVDPGTTTLTDLTIIVDSTACGTCTYTLDTTNITNMSSFGMSAGPDTTIGAMTAFGMDLSITTNNGLVTTSGDVNLGTGSYSLTTNDSNEAAIIISNDINAGSVVLDANGQLSDIAVNADITVTDGSTVSITADDTVTFGGTTDIMAMGSGSVTIQANADSFNGTGFDLITMTSGSTIDAGSGAITLTTTGSGAGNIALGSLSTTSSSSTAISVTADDGSNSGNITDGNGTTTNISAGSGGLVLLAGSQIGGTSDATALEVDAATLDATNSANSLFINLKSDVAITSLNINTQANFTGAGNITQSTTSSIVATALTADVTGSITLENTSNNVTSVSLKTSGAGNSINYVDADDFTVNTTNGVTGVSTTTSAGINLKAVTGKVTVSSAISANAGDIAITADKMDIVAAVTASGQRVTLKSTTSGDAVDLGSTTDTASNTLELSDTELNNITANYLEIGSTSQGAIEVSSDVTPAMITALHLISGSKVNAREGLGGGVVVAMLAVEAGGDVIFSDVSTDVDNLAIVAAGFDTSFYDVDDLDIATVDTVVGVQAKTFTHTGPGPLTETSPIVVDVEAAEEDTEAEAEQEAQVDEATQSTFVTDFTSPIEGGC